MRVLHDLMARVWVTPATPTDEAARVRWRARLVIGRDEGRTFAAVVDSAGVGETVEVKALSGRWLETTDGAEWTWAPSGGRPTPLAAAFVLAAPLAEVLHLEPDDLAAELESYTVPQLRRFATAAGHEGISALRKAELVALLSEPD